MLFPAATLRAMAAGDVTTAFRRWDRSRVKAGGRLRTPAGELWLQAVERVEPADITDAEARAAGFASREMLLTQSFLKGDRPLWRITFTLAPDARIDLRETVPTADEAQEVLDRLQAMARRATFDPVHYLALIAEAPGVRAADLASGLGLETLTFKRQVRRLKEMGLTESLEVGYRLSRRGAHILALARERASQLSGKPPS